jgi:Fe-S-cluster containining protein
VTEGDSGRELSFSNYRGETFTLDPTLYRESLDQLSDLEKRMEEAKGTIATEEAVSMVRALYRVVDRAGASVEDKMSCRAGCASCCRMMVAVTRGEGEILRERIDREPEGERKDRWREKLLARTETLLGIGGSADPTHPFSRLEDLLGACEAYERKNVFCPFLGSDRLCEIYEDRPLMCRMCWTLTDPRDCDPGQGPPVKFRNQVFFRAFELVLAIGKAGFGDARYRPIPLWLTLT